MDDWWNGLDYEKEPGEIKQYIEVFMDAHPQLVENLGLENEVIFELGGKYKAVGDVDEFMYFLLYVRKEFPVLM